MTDRTHTEILAWRASVEYRDFEYDFEAGEYPSAEEAYRAAEALLETEGLGRPNARPTIRPLGRSAIWSAYIIQGDFEIQPHEAGEYPSAEEAFQAAETYMRDNELGSPYSYPNVTPIRH